MDLRRSHSTFLLRMSLLYVSTPSGWAFQFQSRSKEGVQLKIAKLGHGDNEEITELYEQLATLDFNSKRKRVTMVYAKDDVVYVMCKGADSNIKPLISERSGEQVEALDENLEDMAKKGLRTLLVAHSTKDRAWWNSVSKTYKSTSGYTDRGDEKGHAKGECSSRCRICAGQEEIEKSAELRLLGATAIEDKLQDLVPETIGDLLAAGIKVWMLTGDKRETAKNIAVACNLFDPSMEKKELLSNDKNEMNRLITITGDRSADLSTAALTSIYRLLDVEGKGSISKHRLHSFLRALNVPNMNDMNIFNALFDRVDVDHSGHISQKEFVQFMQQSRLSKEEAVRIDVDTGLRKLKIIEGGNGTEDEKRDRRTEFPVSLVVEGEAFSVLFPIRKRNSRPRRTRRNPNRMAQRRRLLDQTRKRVMKMMKPVKMLMKCHLLLQRKTTIKTTKKCRTPKKTVRIRRVGTSSFNGGRTSRIVLSPSMRRAMNTR